MSTAARLRTTVAEFFDVPESLLGPAFRLPGSSDSVARAALDAVIRNRVGRVSRAVYEAKTYGEIESELFTGGHAVTDTPPPIEAATPGPGNAPLLSTRPPRAAPDAVSCGIDMELIENLPPAEDHWESPFYRSFFTPGEIADCLRREDPGPHFAARWCVKEALKKCDGEFLNADMNQIELAADATGVPYLVLHAGGTPRRLAHAVSLSHTPQAAVAIVVKVNAPQSAPVVVPPAVVSTTPRAHARPAGRFPALICLLALALSIFAVYRTYRP